MWKDNIRLYKIWSNMKQRCSNKNNQDYKYYQGKGIAYCDDWEKFENFEKWAMNNGYGDNLTLDRINGDLGYSPENCRWISLEEQQRNKSNNYLVTYDGKTQTLSEWAREYGLPRETLRSRIEKLGYSFEEAIKKKYKSQRNNVIVSYNGRSFTQAEFAREIGVTPQCICQRLKRGFTPENIVSILNKSRR